MVSIPRRGGNFGHSFNARAQPNKAQTAKKRGTLFKRKSAVAPSPIVTSQNQGKDILGWTARVDEEVDSGRLPGMIWTITICQNKSCYMYNQNVYPEKGFKF